jgi:hypothetical protein
VGPRTHETVSASTPKIEISSSSRRMALYQVRPPLTDLSSWPRTFAVLGDVVKVVEAEQSCSRSLFPSSHTHSPKQRNPSHPSEDVDSRVG